MDKENDNQDQSMEEILQSIKRIIADDDEAEAPVAAEVSETGGTDSSEVKGSDVLELKDLVEEGGVEPEIEAADPLSALLDNDVPMAPSAPAPEPIPEPASAAGNDDILSSIDSLLTSETTQASSSAIQQLKQVNYQADTTPAPVEKVAFRSGATVEDLVVESLKPELKAWLNANLPQIVERMVQAEIKKISG